MLFTRLFGAAALDIIGERFRTQFYESSTFVDNFYTFWGLMTIFVTNFHAGWFPETFFYAQSSDNKQESSKVYQFSKLLMNY